MPPKRELTALEVKRISDPGFHSVGGATGLYLSVGKGNAKSWVLRIVVGAKRRDIGLGGLKDVPLAKAREKAREARELVRSGQDPVIERKRARDALIKSQTRALTFQQCALQCYASKSSEFRNAKHKKDWIAALERHAFPKIGQMLINDIQLPDILRVLEPIWHTKTETATRVRQRIEVVFSWAIVSRYREGENPARWDGNLKEVLPNPSKIAKVRHHPALPWQEMGAFMAELRRQEGIAARALEFAILTAARSGEVRGLTWDEIDLDSKIWTIPGDRIKAGRPHTVPLSDAALNILVSAKRLVGSPYVFPAPRGGKLSDVSLLAVVRRMNAPCVPHGFRSTFKDWARSCTAFPDEVSELALAHVSSDATRAAYARDGLLSKRRRMMNDWGAFCAQSLHSGEIISIRSGGNND